METDLSTNCSTAPLTNDFLIRILGSLGAVSFGVCLVALCWLFCLKLYKQFLYRLAAYQVSSGSRGGGGGFGGLNPPPPTRHYE